MSRTTLEYKVNCDKSINDAYNVLKDMNDVKSDTSNFNKAVWIVACSFGGAQFIYMVVNSIFFCTCREKLCYRVNGIVYNANFLAMAIAMLVIVVINF